MPKLPGVSHKRAIGAFKKHGFKVAHEGKHTVLRRGRVILVVPRNNPINAYTMAGIVKGAGIALEDFKRSL